MPALMNNYTAYTQCDYRNSVLSLQNTYAKESVSSSTSIVLGFPDEFNLNRKIIRLIDEFSSLQDNWDEDGALTVEKGVIEKARSLTSLLSKHGQPIFHTAPGPNGEIMLDIRNKNKTRSIEIILYEDKAIAVFFPDEGVPSQQVFNIVDLAEMLQWLNQK